MMVGIVNHLLGPLYTIPMMVGSYSTIWAYFNTKYEWVSFLLFKEKYWIVFSKIKHWLLHGSDRSSIIGDEETNRKAYFNELIMIGYIQNLKKYFYAIFIICNKKSCIIGCYPVPWYRVVSPQQLYHPHLYFKLHLINAKVRHCLSIFLKDW